MTELEFADRLRKYRKSKNMTQQELAERLGVSDKSVSRWENGSYPDVAMLGPLAKELGVTVDDLLGTASPLKKLEQSDLQNWLSFIFAIGGGIGFYLLRLFLPTLLCYIAYWGLMAYGVYLQKNYTFHSKWFHIGNLVMNLFINLEIAGGIVGGLLILDGWPAAVSMETVEKTIFSFMSGNELRIPGYGGIIFLISVVRPLLALALTALTAYCIRRWWHGEDLPKIRFTPKNLSPAKLFPAIFPPILAFYWILFSAETAILPIWVYQHQGTGFMALWLISAAVTAAVLLLSRRRWALLPAGAMLLYTLTFPRLCVTVRAIGLGTGNLYEYSDRLNPNSYLPFLQSDESLLALAVVLSVIYLLFCFINIRQSPPKEENPGKTAPM